MTTLITGGTGLIGTTLADQLLSGGERVVLFTHIEDIHVEDVAGQFAALLRCDAGVFARRRFFNTGGDTATVRELAAAVGRVVPGARVTVTSNGEPDLGGLVTRVSDRALEEAVGYKRRLSPLDAGVRAHASSARARSGLPPLGG